MGRMLLPMGQLGERAYNLFSLRTQVVAGAPCDGTFVSASATIQGSFWGDLRGNFLLISLLSFVKTHLVLILLRISFLSVNSIKKL